MAKKSPKKYKVIFLPDNKEIEVDEGTTLLVAAEKAGIFINSLCGGEGLCGECRLQLVKGNVKASKHDIGFFSGEEIKDGYFLTCQAKVEDNLEVLVPAKSRLEMEKIITEGTTTIYSEPGKLSLRKIPHDPASLFEPLVSKVYLELSAPTLSDNISDVDRVTRELKQKLTYQSYEISLPCLQNLADRIRQNDWKVTATVAKHNNSGRVLQIEAGNTADWDYGLAVDVGT